MKKTLKRLSSLALAFILTMSFTLTAFAADSTVTFTGMDSGYEFRPGSEYTGTDLFDGFKGVMPGDKLTETVTITNDADDCDYIRVYMRAEAHDEVENPLSENVAAAGETVATMSDFLAQLSMKVYNGTELIYDASPDQEAQLTDNVYLGTLDRGESAALTVELEVPIDLGNEYANRVGEVDWVFTVEAFNNEQLTVRKNWVDNDGDVTNTPDSVTVKLLRNGKEYEKVKLSADNLWTHTWSDLADKYEWSVEEVVPEGYKESYKVDGNVVFITNTELATPAPTPTPTPTPGPTESPTPGPTETPSPTPGPTESPTPTPGPSATPTPGPTVTPTPGPTESPSPTPGPSATPTPGPTVTPTPGPTATPTPVPTPEPTETPEPDDPTPTPTPAPDEPEETVDVSVKKAWAGDATSLKNRPRAAYVTLYCGTEAITTVELNEANGWQYTWHNLAADAAWAVLETNIPKGFNPSYSMKDGVVIITNTATLIQTGQTTWPIYVLAIAGIAMIGFGVFVVTKKRKDNNV